jgi:ATP-dependent RNA helicase DOB1
MDAFDVFDEAPTKAPRLSDPADEPVAKKTKVEKEEPFAGLYAVPATPAAPVTPILRRAGQPSASPAGQVTPGAATPVTPTGQAGIGAALDQNPVVIPEVSNQHQICWPKGYVAGPPKPPPEEPAHKFPFTLDVFQREAINALEQEESVLVAAHTSAGKTVVAIYAIAKSLKNKQRVIYTSPIKALSNQKYRELVEDFVDVGLMTGDVTINPHASILVMTTEILRSMLYRGSEIVREVAWVIFDEIHYMRDKERGVVWEETIILLPDKVKFVFLSATIPNAHQFASWIAEIHQQPCHVIYTNYRPTPLQHYIFPAGGDGIQLVVDERGRFRQENFQKVLAALSTEKSAPGSGNKREAFGGSGNKKKSAGGASDCQRIVKMVMSKKYDPVIIFSFSKRECESHALALSKLDFNSPTEHTLVEKVFKQAVSVLSPSDQQLPQIGELLSLLKRGIGIHHSGLLPLLKEVTEILFAEGLVKALFATETFAMGLNMPAKTVVFTSVRKFDGSQMRWITGGEYVQMSGRAGRRGLDDRGIVIMMVDEKLDPDVAKGMVRGESDPLISQFRLSYNMLLNMMRSAHVQPEWLMERSFRQFQMQAQAPEVEEKLSLLRQELTALQACEDEQVVALHGAMRKLEEVDGALREHWLVPKTALPFLQPGRIVRVEGQGWGVLLGFAKRAEKALNKSVAADFVLDILLASSSEEILREKEKEKNKSKSKEEERDTKSKSSSSKSSKSSQAISTAWSILPVSLTLLTALSSIRLYIPQDLRQAASRLVLGKSLLEVQGRLKELPLLDPLKDMGLAGQKVVEDLMERRAHVQKLVTDYSAQSAHLGEETLAVMLESLQSKAALQAEIAETSLQLKRVTSVVLGQDLQRMRRVLRRLQYTNEDNVIEMKGRVAAEIAASDELLVTELIFNGLFNEMSSQEIASVLTSLIFQEKSEATVQLNAALKNANAHIQDTARRVAKVSIECKLPLVEEEYLNNIKPALMEVTWDWMNGATFMEIMKKTDVFEGSIIRCLRRLEELIRELASAATAIGNTELEEKFTHAITLLKRDIIFAASLYL